MLAHTRAVPWGNIMINVPATLLSAAVTVLAVLFVFYTGLAVARMRGKHKIDAPVMTGHPELERAVRVQSNTLEAFPIGGRRPGLALIDVDHDDSVGRPPQCDRPATQVVLTAG